MNLTNYTTDSPLDEEDYNQLVFFEIREHLSNFPASKLSQLATEDTVENLRDIQDKAGRLADMIERHNELEEEGSGD